MAAPSYDRHQFEREPYPVTAATQIDFTDWAKMHRQRHVLFAGRRHRVPLWPRSDEKTRKVVLQFLIGRVQGYAGRSPRRTALAAELAALGSDQERIQHLTELDRKREAQLIKILDHICHEYVQRKQEAGAAAAADARLRRLATEIKSYDHQLCLIRGGGAAAKIVMAIHLTWRVGYSSVEVAQELGPPLTPPGVRQWAHRLNKIARELGYE